VRLAQNWQQFTIRLILQIHKVGSSFRAQEDRIWPKQMEGNLQAKGLNLGYGRGPRTNPLKGHQNVKLRQPLELWSKRAQEDAFYMS